jgi:hypothetical protein
MEVITKQYDVLAVPYGKYSWEGQVRTIVGLADDRRIQGLCFPFFVLADKKPFLFRDITFNGTERELDYVLGNNLPSDPDFTAHEKLVHETYLNICRELDENEKGSVIDQIEFMIDKLYEDLRPTLDDLFSPEKSKEIAHATKNNPTAVTLNQLCYFPEMVKKARQRGKFLSFRRLITDRQDFYESIEN